ncbi:MAG: hypothetical protein E7255_13340 [Lachnospiraceae bacterium]|nr:hypothetical protein [Lachnospiraceae bacterium]
MPASSKNTTIDTAGWYRVAEYQANTHNESIGSLCNSVNISIRRDYRSDNNEYYNMLLMSTYNKSKFVLIGKLVNKQCIDKIRHTIDGANLKAYIEIYYSADKKNTIRMDLFNTVDVANNKWVAISPAATEETIEGVSVMSMMDLTT